MNVKEYQELEILSEQLKQTDFNHLLIIKEKVLDALRKYPDAPQPQNLLGIIAEKNHDKILAMKHYRAAYALGPYYHPARYNMSRLAEIDCRKECLYCENDYKGE